MTLPTNAPSEIVEILAGYRHGTYDQNETRLRLAKLAEGNADIAAFVKNHLQWLDFADSVEWL